MAEGDSATLKLAIDTRPLPSEVEIGLPLQLTGLVTANGYEDVAEIVAGIVAVYDPVYVSVSSRDYFPRQVFDDKPGVGWMLYLPKVVTTQQVPEARALIPVPGAGGKQSGTLIVSVIDTVFSVDNAEHVDAANRIEIRLVDQDLLPRYSDI